MTIGFFGGKMLPLHRGHAYVATQASNMCDNLFIGLSHSKARDEQLCAKGRMAYIPADIRMMWLNMLTKGMPNVKTFEFEDTDGIEYTSWKEGAEKVRAVVGNQIDFVFGSEPSYEQVFRELYPEAEYILIDEGRNFFPTSSTEIRKGGAFEHWNMLLNVSRPYFVKKVVVLGTESCGKSTLVRNLALTYDTVFVEEFGRTMCEEVNGLPLADKYEYIAYGHKMLEYERTGIANKVLFIDTEATVTQYYRNLYTEAKEKDGQIFREIIKLQKHDLYIYLSPDVKQVDDGLRQHGTRKQRAYNDIILRGLLDENGIEYVIVDGSYQDRYLKSIELVNKLLRS
jgi:HTH-type transcriptional repressor of NAD biosynthesis genes